MKQHRGKRRIQRWSGMVALFGVLVAGLLTRYEPLERGELITHDLRFNCRGPRPTRARIVLAVIGESTLDAWREPMISWGLHYRQVIEQAAALGVTWIGLDMIPSQGSDDPELNRQFALGLAGGRVILSNARGQEGTVKNPIPVLLYAHAEQAQNIGSVNMRADPDDKVRRAAVFDEDRETHARWLSFPAVLALRIKGQSPTDESALQALLPAEAAAEDPATGTTGQASGAPASAVDTFWINYVGFPGDPDASGGGTATSAFPRIKIEKLADGDVTPVERSALQGAVLLIGPTYEASNDRRRGPFRVVRRKAGIEYTSDEYDGVEIHAHALATLLDRRPLLRAPRVIETAITLAAGLLATLVAFALPFGWGLATVLVLSGAWMGGAVAVFARDQLWPMVGPVLAMGLSWGGYHVARSVEEARRRLWLQGVFGRFVTPDIVTHFMRHPGALELGGEEFDVTVMFIDLRGHTTAAQGRSPAGVLEELNVFFAEVVPVIDRYGGLVLGYRGDGLLAVFGAPRILADHARAAVTAAITIARATRRVNAAREAAGEAPVQLGCGINTGRVVAGNIGVFERSEYTVIGDAVNIAARLEGLNKEPVLNEEFPSEVVISQATYDCLTDPPPTRGPFAFEIRGREGRMCVYQVRIEA